MTVLINSLAVTEASKVYYKPEIRNLLESHVQFIIDHPNTQVVNIANDIIYKYEGDFYGLLYILKVLPQYHWIVMRINGMTTPTDLNWNRLAILLPDYSLIDTIISMYRASAAASN